MSLENLESTCSLHSNLESGVSKSNDNSNSLDNDNNNKNNRGIVYQFNDTTVSIKYVKKAPLYILNKPSTYQRNLLIKDHCMNYELIKNLRKEQLAFHESVNNINGIVDQLDESFKLHIKSQLEQNHIIESEGEGDPQFMKLPPTDSQVKELDEKIDELEMSDNTIDLIEFCETSLVKFKDNPNYWKTQFLE